MEHLIETLRGAERQLRSALDAVFHDDEARRSTEPQLLEALSTAAAVARLAEAAMIECVGEVGERSDDPAPAARMTTRFGCRTVKELVQRATRVSGRTAGDLVAAGRSIVPHISVSTGETLPADFPAVREAVASGDLGVDGALAITAVIGAAASAHDHRAAAEAELVAAARGVGVDDAPPPSADELRMQAQVWAMWLDPDGAEPRESAADRKRGVTLGMCRDGLIPLRGQLLPEVAGQLQRVFDSILNPKVDDRGPRFIEDPEAQSDEPDPSPPDPRTRAQKQHDAFATALHVAAASGGLPTLGGAAPTLVVSVREADMKTGRGFAHIDGIDDPVSLSVARHTACTGAVQRVISDERGRIVSLSIADRIFSALQRRAIGARDGGCLIPGCFTPAAWCEIHHVEEYSRGGPTTTDNGVPLCWHHHRTIDRGEWKIRMNHGVPEVRGPTWWDPSGRWRAASKSPTTLLNRLARARP